MGGIPSRLHGHFFTRTKQRFNIESRTEKLLKQEKLPPAPRYQSDEEILQKLHQEFPSASDEIRSKNVKLQESLKQVYVRSYDPPGFDPDINRKMNVDPKRPLPKKFVSQAPWAGFQHTKARVTPKGKLTVGNLNLLLATFHQRKTETPIEDLSTKYNLNPSDVQKLVEYHSLFTMYEVKTEKAEPESPYEPKDDWVADYLDKTDRRQNVTPVPEAKKLPLLPDKDSSKSEPKK